MHWVLSPPFSTGFHHVIFRTGGSAATRLHLRLFLLPPYRALKFGEPAVRDEGVTKTCERMRAKFHKPPLGGEIA